MGYGIKRVSSTRRVRRYGVNVSNDPFIFDDYEFDPAAGVLRLHYSYENGPVFEEKITFPKPTHALSPNESAALDNAFRLIFLLAGVSYYKAYVPRDLKCTAFALDKDTAAFVEKVYRHGLGEFAYRNKLDLSDKIHFFAETVTPMQAKPLKLPHRLLVPAGGGKDSIVSIELLKQAGENVTIYAQGRSAYGLAAPIEATIKVAGLPAIKVERALSENLTALNKSGAFNGHVPITAILSSIAIACAILHGYDTIVMSNEHSASAPNLKIGALEINHQYSKSFGFEKDFTKFVTDHISPNLTYFSLLRPLTEAAIARRFAKLEKYHGIFRSCNSSFRQDIDGHFKDWCCNCPKCRFVFLALAPFIEKQHLIGIFGKNLLDDPAQSEGFAELCGLAASKPFECVGEIEESALLMQKLARSDAWKDDGVVKDLGARLAPRAKDFDKHYPALFTFKSGHLVPDRYLELLNADRGL